MCPPTEPSVIVPVRGLLVVMASLAEQETMVPAMIEVLRMTGLSGENGSTLGSACSTMIRAPRPFWPV